MWKSKKTEMKRASINTKNSREQQNEYIKFNNALQALITKCEIEIEDFMDNYDGTEEERKEYLEDIDFYKLLKDLKNTSVYENIQYKCKRKLQGERKKIIYEKDFEPVVKNGKSKKSKYVMCRCNSPVLRHNWKRHVRTPLHLKKLENLAIGKECIEIDDNILSMEETRKLIEKSSYCKDSVEIHNDDGSMDINEPLQKRETKKEKKEKKEKKKTKKKRKLILSKEVNDFRDETKKILEKRKKSAVMIQKHIRGHITRNRVEKMKKEKKETLYENKVILMQSCIRRYISIQRVTKMKKINKIKNKQQVKIKCECGSTYTARMKARHFKTKKHCTFIENKK